MELSYFLTTYFSSNIWICDHKKVEKFPGDITAFKKKLQEELGLTGGKLKGDASVAKVEKTDKQKKQEKKDEEEAAEKLKNHSISFPKPTPAPAAAAAVPLGRLSPTAGKLAPAPVAKPASAGWGSNSEKKAEPAKTDMFGRPVTNVLKPAEKTVGAKFAPLKADAPVAVGLCSEHGKVDWRKCEVCEKRHP